MNSGSTSELHNAVIASEPKQSSDNRRFDCFASLAMTSGYFGGPRKLPPYLQGLLSLTSNFPSAPEMTKSL